MLLHISELNWDFEALEKNYEVPMGLAQPSAGSGVVEPMDHSGHYSQHYPSMSGMLSSNQMKSTWTTTGAPAHYPPSSLSQMEAQLPIWTSAPVIHPNVIGYQTVGMQGTGAQLGQNAGRERQMNAMDIGVTNSVTTARPYVPPTSIGKRLPLPPSACAVDTARLPRNSSDSQLYLLAAGDSPSKSRSHVPVELQAPNLVAQLKLTKPRQMLIEEKAKRMRLPRNKSAPGLASLDTTSQLRKTPQVGGVRAKRLGRIPRNRSDSALTSLIRQSELSASRSRRDSESSDSPPMMRPTSSTSHHVRTEPMPHVFTEHQVYQPSGEGGTTGRPPSQLVHDMVTHLMSKGISMEEILNKLTSMAAAGTVPQAQAISHQVSYAVLSQTVGIFRISIRIV